MVRVVSLAHEPGMLHLHQSRGVVGRAVIDALPNRDPGHTAPPSPVRARDLARALASTADAGTSTGPWLSPLYPRNGITLWDRIRVSSLQERRAFLLGTAIQLHTPATAATPGPTLEPRRVFPSKEG